MTQIEIYKRITEDILKLMSSGTIPWQKPWSCDSVPRNGVTKRPYNGVNAYLAFLPYGSNDFYTFNQIKDLGGSVKRGEKGFYVVYWKQFTPKQNPDDVEAEEEIKTIPLLRHYVVWNKEQCSGLPSPDNVQTKENNPFEDAEKVIREWIDKPAIHFGGDMACYSPTLDKINCPELRQFVSSNEYYSTLFHECIHSTGNKSRLNRDMSGDFGDESYSKEELVAELGSAFICSMLGIDNTSIKRNQAAYLQGWMKQLKENTKLFFDAARLAGKAVDYIKGKEN